MESNIDNKPEEIFIISASPHLSRAESTSVIMWIVSLALLPAAIFGVFTFGIHALLILIMSIVFAVGAEVLFLFLRKKTIAIDDGSAVLTGLLVGLNMPPTVPLYIPIITSIIAIGLVKHAFGGLGENWANPAIAGRVFALFAWTKHMTTWKAPFSADAVTTATPLGAVKSVLAASVSDVEAATSASGILEAGPLQTLATSMDAEITYMDLFFGFKGGCIGEISVFLLLIGALYLIYRKIVTLDIPVTYIGTVILIAWIFDGLFYNKGLFQGDFLFHLLTGGLALGAFFMATDMVTTPVTVKGRIIFGIGCGVITMLIRMLGSLPEGVSLSILFMNMLTPAIDRFIKIKPMGYIKNNN